MSARTRVFKFRMAFSAVAVVVLAGIPSAHAQPAFFMGLGDLPGGDFFSQPLDISSDGSVVVGLSHIGANISEAYRWTRDTGMTQLDGLLGDGFSLRVSGDGSVIVREGGASPVRWTAVEGIVPLPPTVGLARGISGDGLTIVGQSSQRSAAGFNQAIRWTATGGVESLFTTLPSTVAWDASYDGSVILGNEQDLGLFVWTAVEGTTFVGGPEGNSAYKQISDNGKVVASSIFDVELRAYRWTKETGAVKIGNLPDGVAPVTARGISADGSIIVGNTASAPGVPQQPYIWDTVHGPRYLIDVLVNDGGLSADIAGWTSFIARGVSGDGRTVTGYGTNPVGGIESWVAYLGTPVPEPSTLTLIAFALATLGGRWARRLPWHDCGS